MGSYAVFLLAGLYPVPATRQYLLSSPSFPEISFFNPVLDTTTTIRSKYPSGNPTEGQGSQVYIQVAWFLSFLCSLADREQRQSVFVNGQPYKSNCYLDWDVFTRGALVELTLTDDVNVTCGVGEDALPPSLSTGGFNWPDCWELRYV